jgi:hypothetical protein
MDTTITEVLNGLADLTGPDSFVGKYQAERRAQAKEGRLSLPFAERFTIALFEFHPTGYLVRPKWKPAHALSVPSLKLLKESDYSDEISLGAGESPFMTRDDAISAAADENRLTLAKIKGGDLRDLCWLLVVELFVPKARMHYADVDWHSGTWGINHMLIRLVHPTPDEVAQFAK